MWQDCHWEKLPENVKLVTDYLPIKDTFYRGNSVSNSESNDHINLVTFQTAHVGNVQMTLLPRGYFR